MGKGSKQCLKCSKGCGPRSRWCPHCGAGFIVKGVQYPDKNLIESAHTTVEPDDNIQQENEELDKYFVRCTDETEREVLQRYYGEEAKSWDSIDGQYRLRECLQFMGIDVGDKKPYHLLWYNSQLYTWDLCVGKHKFKTVKAAIKHMLKHKAGKVVTRKGLKNA